MVKLITYFSSGMAFLCPTPIPYCRVPNYIMLILIKRKLKYLYFSRQCRLRTRITIVLHNEKESILQNDITMLNVCAPNNRASKYMR